MTPQLRTLAGTLVLVPLLAASALAQGGQKPKKPQPLPPLEVVATRIPESTHDVPASIEVISGADLKARGARSLRDALALATGVSLAPGGDGGPASSVPEFWGLREFDAFLLVVDDVPWGGALNPALASLSLQDVDRIEILRGPAPVTYGATSFVGVIHVVHSAASARAKYFEAHGGSYGSGGAAVDLGLLSGGSWSSRLSADVDRQAFKDDRTEASRGHALWRLSREVGASRTWLRGDLTLLRQDPASPHPREGPGLSSSVPLDANYNPKDARLDENRFALAAGLERPAFGGATWGSTASFTHASTEAFRGFLVDISNSTNNATGFKQTIDLSDLYADTHILWPAKSKLRFMTGADLLFSKGEGKGAIFDYTVPLSGATETTVTEPSALGLDSEDQRIFLGAYASTEFRPVNRVTLTGGLRLNRTSERHDEGDPSSTNTRLSGSLGALVGIRENGSDHLRLFANYRNTFKPAAFDFGLAENEGVLKPETSQSYEGGVKVRSLAGRLDVEASVFQMDFKNLVTATTINNLPALINSGKTRFKGFELGANLRVANATSARASYSYHDGKFVDFVQDFDGTPTQLAGKRIEMSAKHLFSAGLAYAPETGISLTGSVNYIGQRFLNKRNTAPVGGFATVDAGIGYRFNRLEVRIDGRNLGDRRDAVSESEFGDAQYYRMPARTILAGVAVRY
ncbi:MAG TPA: TonB-dependent receptor [Gemmatimonadales bacterium]|nr:TonB-dependent receptor [Gemmatimonadales bacterium]